MPQTVETMNKPGCVLCEFVMHRLREWLQDGHTQDELKQGLEQICALMPGSVKVRIQSIRKNYIYYFINEIIPSLLLKLATFYFLHTILGSV